MKFSRVSVAGYYSSGTGCLLFEMISCYLRASHVSLSRF